MSTYTFDAEFQTNIAAHAVRDIVFVEKTEGLLDPAYLTLASEAYLVRLAQEHHRNYGQLPDLAIIAAKVKADIAAKSLRGDEIGAVKDAIRSLFEADLTNRDFYVESVADFARRQAVEAALSESIDIHEKGGEFGKIVDILKKAVDVGVQEDLGGADLVATRKARFNLRTALSTGTVKPTGITTGHREIDLALGEQEGLERGGLTIAMGGAKAGKSMLLGDWAVAAARAGYNVLYTTHENSKEVASNRMDACIAGVTMQELRTKAAYVDARLEDFERCGAGKLCVHEFPMGAAKVSDIRRLVKRYQSKGVTFDLLVVDYADLLLPSYRTGEIREDSRLIYVELRALAQMENLACLTATQANRDGMKSSLLKSTDVAEDINRVRVADAFITINATEDEKKDNILRLYLSALRNAEDGIMIHCISDRARMRMVKKVDRLS